MKNGQVRTTDIDSIGDNRDDIISVNQDGVKIAIASSEELYLPHLWLRDNCSCDECRITRTQEKSFILSDVSVDLAPVTVDLANGLLSVRWPDGHYSEHIIEDILSLSKPRHDPPIPWADDFKPEYVDWAPFLEDDAVAVAALTSFLRSGVIVINGAPKVPNTLELLASRLGPVRELLFDRIHNVSLEAHVYNVAHTSLALPLHNDFASYSFPPSAQALHMLENETEGGRSIIVDAWAVAEQIREQRPDYFETLCHFALPFREFDEENETYAVEPIIKCNSAGEIVNLRFSNQLMQTINPMQPGVAEFYQAYHYLCSHITDEKNQIKFRLEGSHTLLVAAHRVLHAREAFVPMGKRHLQDAYFEFDNIANKIVVLKNNESARARSQA